MAKKKKKRRTRSISAIPEARKREKSWHKLLQSLVLKVEDVDRIYKSREINLQEIGLDDLIRV